jgi:hypothetical protein
MDYQRCADLHNEILYRGWIGSGQDWVQPQTWWEEQAPSDETASHLSPSLIEFLKRAYRQPKLGRPIYFFYYLQDLSYVRKAIAAMKHLIDAIEAKIDRLAQPASEYVDLPLAQPRCVSQRVYP